MARDDAYRRVEKEIEAARDSGATKLNLNGRSSAKDDQLTALPASLGQLTQLETLRLSDNQLTALPEWLRLLTKLTSLNVYGNQLTVLPEWLGQLQNLKSLVIAHNRLVTLPESLDQLKQLEWFNLEVNQLRTLPQSLRNLKVPAFFCMGTMALGFRQRFLAHPMTPIHGRNLTAVQFSNTTSPRAARRGGRCGS